jgi:DNA polymerase-4
MTMLKGLVYKGVKLLDLNGINTRFQARLNAYGIFTPTEFYHAPLEKLKKQVFQSILGYYWYLRLRGHEIDAVDFKRKSLAFPMLNFSEHSCTFPANAP